jgi:hypothetical protein
VAIDDLGDGRLDELAARHGLTIAEVRRMAGPKQIGRRGNDAERSAAPVAEDDPVDPPAQPRAVASEAPYDLEAGSRTWPPALASRSATPDG